MKTKLRKYSFIAIAILLIANHSETKAKRYAEPIDPMSTIIENIISDNTVITFSPGINFITNCKAEFSSVTIQYHNYVFIKSTQKDETQRALRKNLKI
ncbi:hypothetical protein [Melioribacter sp. OK-6-Me]|uniref:hypothetical protein n=1 Tax=unclassified Melioribacter TaxID=2627329 RepID=UPI003EDA0E62